MTLSSPIHALEVARRTAEDCREQALDVAEHYLESDPDAAAAFCDKAEYLLDEVAAYSLAIATLKAVAA